MPRATVWVVGLGPGDVSLLTPRARELIVTAPVARLRTRRHPAADDFAALPSYDALYDAATDFDELYARIVDDLVGLAQSAPDGRVVYAVPGSPVVAERTVELLRARPEVALRVEPAVSVLDAACAALGRDPMAVGLRVLDALDSADPLRGPGPLLVLQTHSPAVLASLADRLAPETPVIVLHHLGLGDEALVPLPARRLGTFAAADHLTAVWVEKLDTVGDAVEDLVALTATLRAQCAWDRAQSHASLAPHLLEEAHETLSALERYVATGERDPTELVEELGDLWFQILIHAELGREADQFDLFTVATALHAKLVRRHPHVFGDDPAASADEARDRWDARKRVEQTGSVTASVPDSLPALALYQKLRERAVGVGVALDGDAAAMARVALGRLDESANDPTVWAELLCALADVAVGAHIDLESVMRHQARSLRAQIVAREEKTSSTSPD